MQGSTLAVIEWDTRSLDYGSDGFHRDVRGCIQSRILEEPCSGHPERPQPYAPCTIRGLGRWVSLCVPHMLPSSQDLFKPEKSSYA